MLRAQASLHSSRVIFSLDQTTAGGAEILGEAQILGGAEILGCIRGIACL